MKKKLKIKLTENDGKLIGGFYFLSTSQLTKIKGGIKDKESNVCQVDHNTNCENCSNAVWC
ncbi:hypothetical protein NU08_1334 [Flavobacterium anhuiense]|uniref:Uncharacterized protein n=1 Tax=Flavobacterium anhuiense TaxID=459526 RepID=A0A444W193_9FLAO|nr:hypothetical protein [Flavobacterium anhuiense]RYJ39665.1 hypothetical protein NU08_1334 [Flavobacterium anhuiense]